MTVFGSANHVEVDFDDYGRQAEGQVESPGSGTDEDNLKKEEEKVQGDRDEVITSKDEGVTGGERFGRFLE